VWCNAVFPLDRSYRAVKHLQERGHTRIATIRWEIGIVCVNSNKKHAGYQAALADAGLEVKSEYVKSIRCTQGHPEWRSIRAPAAELAALANPPTAVFVENSFVSLPLLYPGPNDAGELPSSLREWEIVHFEDWSLDPVDDVLTGKLFYPECETTVVAIRWEEIGAMAAKLLLDQVRGEPRPRTPTVLRVSPTLQKVKGAQRESVGREGLASQV